MFCQYCGYGNGYHGSGCPIEPGLSDQATAYRRLQFNYGLKLGKRFASDHLKDDPRDQPRHTAFLLGFGEGIRWAAYNQNVSRYDYYGDQR